MNDERIRKLLEPMFYFRNNALDILKLLVQEDEEKAQACRNLLFQSFSRWYRRLEENLRQALKEASHERELEG